ncbi:hypothetical protein ACLBWZ_08900 [Brucellaceae bacterium C25G]
MATNMGRKTYVSKTPQPAEMSLDDFEALTDWLEVRFVTEIGESGVNTNILSLPVMDTKFTEKGKGISDAGDVAITVRYDAADPGQALLRELGETNMYYAFKFQIDDKATPTGAGSIEYNRGLITGPLRSNGAPEDFVTETFTGGFTQQPFWVSAT